MINHLKLNFQATVLAAIAVTLYWLLPISDSDYYWHLKTGELIYNSHAIPSTDPFSFTMQGEKWVLHEWLFQLLLYITYNSFGENGIRALIVSSVAATIYFLHSTLTARRQNKTIIFALTVWVLLSLIPFMTPRPQLASYLLFSYFLYATQLTIATKNPKHLLPLPILMVLWVNLHGGYLIGITLLTITTATTWLNEKQNTYPATQNSLTRPFALTTLITILSSSINPDFIYHWGYPFYVLSMEATSQIAEWHSPNFKSAYAISFLLLVMLFIFSSVYTKKRPTIEKLVIPLFFVMAGFMSARNIPFALLSVIALAPKPGDIDTRPFSYIANIFTQLQNKYIKLTSKGSDIGRMEYVINMLLLISLASILPLMNSNESKIKNEYPRQATDYFIEKNLHGNILSEYANGGYLIYKLHPYSLVFIDGRADMYGDKIFKDHMNIMRGTANWDTLLNEHEINYIICKNDTPIRQLLLQSDNFKSIYVDDHYSVIVNLRTTAR